MTKVSLEQLRISEGDLIEFTTSNGNLHTGKVVDGSDPSMLRVELANNRQVYVGRAAATLRGK